MEAGNGSSNVGATHDSGTNGEAQTYAEDLTTVREQEIVSSLQYLAICSIGELFGGIERHILGILGGLKAHGARPLLLLFHDGELAAQARELGIEPVILPSSNRSILFNIRRLAKVLEQAHIRVVHVHGYKATVYCALARRRYPFALVKTEHGLPEPMTGRPIQALRERFYRLLDSTATRRSNATVCYVTEELLAHYQRTHSGLRVLVIPNGVSNIERDKQKPPEFRGDRFNLVIVGRIDTVKGHHFAIEALTEKRFPSDIDLYFIGTGPCEPELQTLAETHGIAHRVHFLGFRRNVYEHIAHCHSLLMPSLHEGLPYTLLEAMALSAPIIAARIGGLAEVLEDGVTGLLIPPGDAKALARAIVRLYDNPELCQQLGEYAQCFQRSRYSLETMSERYLGVYRELLLTELSEL